MARIKLQAPEQFDFSTTLEVRISDINYGNHLSNDAYLSLMHEALMRFFASLGWSEKNLAGASVIMGDVAIVYKKECFYGDILRVDLAVTELGGRSFDLFYRFSKQDESLACEAKTGMVCFDYQAGKTVAVPADFKNAFPHLLI